MDLSEESLVYESTDDALSAMWHYNDSESEVVRAWYAVGTYPFSDDLSERKELDISITLSSYLSNNEVEPDILGKTIILTRAFLLAKTLFNCERSFALKLVHNLK